MRHLSLVSQRHFDKSAFWHQWGRAHFEMERAKRIELAFSVWKAGRFREAGLTTMLTTRTIQ